MRKYLILLTMGLATFKLMSQDFASLADKTFENAEAYKQAESQILVAANYLLSTPVNENELNRQNAFLYIFKWMEGTPDHTFSLDEEVMKLTKGDSDYLTLYLAGAVKTVLEEEQIIHDEGELQQKATALLVEYCSDDQNGLKPNRPIKKLLKDRS